MFKTILMSSLLLGCSAAYADTVSYNVGDWSVDVAVDPITLKDDMVIHTDSIVGTSGNGSPYKIVFDCEQQYSTSDQRNEILGMVVAEETLIPHFGANYRTDTMYSAEKLNVGGGFSMNMPYANNVLNLNYDMHTYGNTDNDQLITSGHMYPNMVDGAEELWLSAFYSNYDGITEEIGQRTVKFSLYGFEEAMDHLVAQCG